VVDSTKGCQAKPNGEFALEHIQGQIERKVYTSQLDLKIWIKTFELVLIQWTWGQWEGMFKPLHYL